MKCDIVGPGYLGRSPVVNSSRCVNLYPEVNGQDAKASVSLVGTPGTLQFANTGSASVRGMHSFNSLLYVVIGGKLYSVSDSGALSAQLGNNLATSTGRVVMADNGLAPTGGNQLVMADGLNIYVWNVNTSTFTTVAITAHTICFLAGHFIANIGGGRFQVSDLYDGTTWGALNISTADASPDDLLTVFANHGEAWLFGEYTTEIWYPNAATSPPLSRVGGGVLDYGIAARYSVAKGSNTLLWLATQREGDGGELVGVGMASGYAVKIVSPPSINYQFGQYSTVADAFGYCYAEDGHEFYVLTFPTANATWAYDITTGLWHERSTYAGSPYAVGRHLGNCYAYHEGNRYIGDYRNGKIYKMDSAYLDEGGDPIASVRVAVPFNDKENLNRLFFSSMQLDCEVGGGMANRTVLTSTYNVWSTTFNNGTWDAATNGKYIWFGTSSYLTRVDLSNIGNLVTTVTHISSIYTGLKFANGYLWALDTFGLRLDKIEPETGSIVGYVNLAPLVNATGLEYDSARGYLWLTTPAGNAVYKVDMSSLSMSVSVAVGADPYYIKYDGSNLWVSNNTDGTVSRVDPDTATVVATITVGNLPWGITFDGTYIYVLNVGDGTISKIDRVSNTVVGTFTGFTCSPAYGAHGLDCDGSYLYVPSTSSVLNVVSLSTGAVLRAITIDYIGEMVFSFLDGVWVVSAPGNNPNYAQQITFNRSAAPVAVLSWSDDGGMTWSKDHEKSMGQVGEYATRVSWDRLGTSRDRVFRIAMSDPIKKVLLSGYVTAEAGDS